MSIVAQENWQSIEGCLASLRSESDEFETELDSLFADLDQLRSELGQKAETVEEQCQRLATEREDFRRNQQDHSQVTHQLELQEARLAEAIAELEATRTRLVSQEEEAIAAADEQAQSLLQQFQQERDTLRSELEAAQQSLAELSQQLAEQEGRTASSQEEHALAAQQLVDLQQRHAESITELEAAKARLVTQEEEATAALGEQVQSLQQQFQQDRDALNNELESAKQKLDELKQELSKQERSAAASREENARVTQQLIDLQQRHSETITDLGNVREQLSLKSAGDSKYTIELETRLRQIEDERDSLRKQLDQSLAEIGKHADSARELAEARQQVVELRDEAIRLQAEKSEEDGGQQQQVSELEQERTALETELELVRGRAADLQEQVLSYERSLEEQRLEMNAELRQLRELVERNATPVRQAVATPLRATEGSSASEEAPAHQAADGRAVDPVVNSVMAQFAKLQKDVSARRKKRKE